jgi:hypothetical protein
MLMNIAREATSQVLALIDDAAAGEPVLEMSSVLAQVLHRELSVVVLESAAALAAAALPFTQVLPHAGSVWLPFGPDDIEQGYRTQVARVRALAARVMVRQPVRWSLRVMRCDPAEARQRLWHESNLLFVGATSPTRAPVASARRRRRGVVVAVVGTGGEAGEHALRVARQLADALPGGLLEIASVDTTRRPGATGLESVRSLRPDVLVIPRSAVEFVDASALRCPVLLVD